MGADIQGRFVDIPTATFYAANESCQGWLKIQTSEQEEQQSCSYQTSIRPNRDSSKSTRRGRGR